MKLELFKFDLLSISPSFIDCESSLLICNMTFFVFLPLLIFFSWKYLAPLMDDWNGPGLWTLDL